VLQQEKKIKKNEKGDTKKDGKEEIEEY